MSFDFSHLWTFCQKCQILIGCVLTDLASYIASILKPVKSKTLLCLGVLRHQAIKLQPVAAFQISRYDSSAKSWPGNVIDGKKNTHYHTGGSCMHSDKQITDLEYKQILGGQLINFYHNFFLILGGIPQAVKVQPVEAFQISRYDSTAKSRPGNVIDGNRNTHYHTGGSCMATQKETNPWWSADLGKFSSRNNPQIKVLPVLDPLLWVVFYIFL